MGKDFRRSELDQNVVHRISERLSKVGGLYLPRSMRTREENLSPTDIKNCLVDLLSRDAALFLERYGSNLNTEELQEFEILNHDYEINWHLKHLKSLLNPTTEEKRMHAVTIKNRRLAYMNKLISDGTYFSEDAMRERAPFLHHEYVGKFQDPSNRGFFRAGERWSETLMRQSEEARILQRIKEEQERLGIQEDFEEEEEEEEDDEDSTTDEETNNEEHRSSSPGEQILSEDQGQKISDDRLQEGLENFTQLMKEKFLSGEDTDYVDYSYIDNNEALDDHWWKEITQDAEDKYFEE
eukprot:TRINITY_DN12337_c0_g1_i1.p1 TRINITY_DN12337_c0_g1~~TRINITY_DN12337_c0_g1_i1.p1  ORF type:complete len:296 (-),score=69.79 TRINITY_DN12337_c0_g1_i1:150-1037(-)